MRYLILATDKSLRGLTVYYCGKGLWSPNRTHAKKHSASDATMMRIAIIDNHSDRYEDVVCVPA